MTATVAELKCDRLRGHPGREADAMTATVAELQAIGCEGSLVSRIERLVP